mmetsp:Transcript_18510/g.32973  ORF Transcript_18510/g.32973 Transcript_18510/m.32973 type:complete len:187 (-) Transcript_18510:121-681(-)
MAEVLNGSKPGAQFVVKLHSDGYQAETLQGMAASLTSGRVRMLIWKVAPSMDHAPDLLSRQVEYVAAFGYAIYIASARPRRLSSYGSKVGKEEGYGEAAVWLRIDRGFWEEPFEKVGQLLSGAGEVSLVAVAADDPFRAYLDARQLLCSRRAEWATDCQCHVDELQMGMDEYASCGKEATRNGRRR